MKKQNFQWTIRELIERRNIVEFPEYQREPTVWNLEKKRRLIDSILREFDIASFYFFRKEDETYDCIDGRQRINAILSYVDKNDAHAEDNKFQLTITNEIYNDGDILEAANGKRFDELPEDLITRFLEYVINVVEISYVDNQDELNLLFLRLQLGQILNAGERLRAMTGEMRDYIFNDISKHAFFQGISIPYRRYAREQVAAQITLNYFSKLDRKAFRRSRYVDLQDFFKSQSQPSQGDKKRFEDIRQRLDKTRQQMDDKLGIIGNRAVAVSVFLLVSEFIDDGRDDELYQFKEFLVKFLKTLKWQIPKGIDMAPAYRDLLTFQTSVNQAAGERYAIQNRHDYLVKAFSYFKETGLIEGDEQYESGTDKNADEERSKYLE